MLRAIFDTRAIQEYSRCCIDSSPEADTIISRYAEARSLADVRNNNPLTSLIRRAADVLVLSDGMDGRHTWETNIRALCQAATSYCHPERVLELLDSKNDGSSIRNEGASLDSKMESENKMHAFVGAAHTGNIVKVREILASGADVNRESSCFGRPLECACRGGHEDIVRLLLEHGADADPALPPCGLRSKLPGFGTPLQSACFGSNENIVRLLLKLIYRARPASRVCHFAALQAARMGHLNIVMLLLENETPEEIQRGRLLSEASKYGQLDFVRMVLDNGAFSLPNRNYSLRLSLDEASSRGYHGIVQLLLAHGDKGIHGDFQKPLFVACKRGYERVVRLLLEHGAEIRVLLKNLALPARSGQAHIVLFLLERQAHLDPKDWSDQGHRALYVAKSEGHDSVVRILADHGVDLWKFGWGKPALKSVVEPSGPSG